MTREVHAPKGRYSGRHKVHCSVYRDWNTLCQNRPGPMRRCYIELANNPFPPMQTNRHHQLKGKQAAEACFGTPKWPVARPVPQVSIEFDVADAAAVGPAARELEQAGYELLHPPREEPWGQTVARLQSPEGAIVGISYAPVLHDQD